MGARVVIVCVALAGCGRLGFDPLGAGGDGGPPLDVLLAPPTQRQLVVGWAFSCVLEPTGALWCWGENSTSQLASGPGPSELAPIPIAIGHTFVDLALGQNHACALDTTGIVWCWGENNYGELGVTPELCGNGSTAGDEACDDGNFANGDGCTLVCTIGATPPLVTSPTAVPGNRRYRRVFAHRFSTCAIAFDDTLWCWGRNGAGQLGVGHRNDRPRPTQVVHAPAGDDTGWVAVGVGSDHMCATKSDDTLWCWGANGSGQLGQGAAVFDRNRPSRVAGAWQSSGAGSDMGCAIAAPGQQLFCMGLNDRYQLGLGDVTNRDVPTEVSNSAWAQVAIGSTHACARKTDQTLFCWGDNAEGQIGNGMTGGMQPTIAYVGITIQSVDSGSLFSCAIDTNGRVLCWGSGVNGRLGTGTTGTSNVPVPVMNL